MEETGVCPAPKASESHAARTEHQAATGMRRHKEVRVGKMERTLLAVNTGQLWRRKEHGAEQF